MQYQSEYPTGFFPDTPLQYPKPAAMLQVGSSWLKVLALLPEGFALPPGEPQQAKLMMEVKQKGSLLHPSCGWTFEKWTFTA